jgi:hypothetical protein
MRGCWPHMETRKPVGISEEPVGSLSSLKTLVCINLQPLVHLSDLSMLGLISWLLDLVSTDRALDDKVALPLLAKFLTLKRDCET